MESDKPIITQLIKLLTEGNAHATFEQAVADLPEEYRGKRPDGLPYSVWELVEHIRIAQYDILDFSINPNYKEMVWPDDYWPENQALIDDAAWHSSIKQIQEDKKKFIAVISDPNADLYTPFKHGTGQNLLREALLIADHNSYHVGQIVLIRRLLGQWGE
ncbi:DinB family protein [Fulvivirga ligni]|uniref:DinB family protein n=1 Tax=Fulvivirga ligni TaxID=2904246 RepID=UPI001F30B6D5|nr:DinB family protein [Fulvivirga ligni]UII23624.1 DinB family protein [Fulvivirga ligni]